MKFNLNKLALQYKFAEKSRADLIELLKKLKNLAERPGYEAEGLASRERMRVIQEKYGIKDEDITGLKKPVPQATRPTDDLNTIVVSLEDLDLKPKKFVYLVQPDHLFCLCLNLDGLDFTTERAMQRVAEVGGYRSTSNALSKGCIYIFRMELMQNAVFIEYLETKKNVTTVVDILNKFKAKGYKGVVMLVANGEEKECTSPDDAIEFLGALWSHTRRTP
jgi:hypothetical protein